VTESPVTRRSLLTRSVLAITIWIGGCIGGNRFRTISIEKLTIESTADEYTVTGTVSAGAREWRRTVANVSIRLHWAHRRGDTDLGKPRAGVRVDVSEDHEAHAEDHDC